MPNFNITIPDDERAQLSIPPPPIYNKRTGEWIPYASPTSPRYADMAARKQDMVVCVDEELDVINHPGSMTHFRMRIRNLPWQYDLRLVLRAAQHMMLVGTYTVCFRQAEGLDPKWQSGFWDVEYTSATENVGLDWDTNGDVPVYVPYAKRRRIWIELFTAMGYRVSWGNAVLNVRHRK